MRFSVIIPAYNRQDELPKCLDTVLSQSYNDEFEVIVVDNGSTDNTKQVVADYISKDSRVKYFWQENSGSPAGSRNTGIKKSSGEWIAFLDSDDHWYKDKLKEVSSIIDNASLEIIAISHYEDKEVNGEYHSTLNHGSNLSDSPYDELLFNGNSLSTSAMTVRRDKLIEANLFDERRDYFAVEDYDLWMRLSLLGKFAYIHKPLGVFAISGSNMSGNIELINNNLKQLVLDHIDRLDLPNKEKLKKIHGSRVDYYKGRSYQINGDFLKAIPILFRSIIDDPFNIKKFASLIFAIVGSKR